MTNQVLELVDDKMKAEFRLATRQAIEENESEFVFRGFLVYTSDAIDLVSEIDASRTYH